MNTPHCTKGLWANQTPAPHSLFLGDAVRVLFSFVSQRTESSYRMLMRPAP
nr:MAG TPA: hypothetical protein [Caudoviricetes sp.]